MISAINQDQKDDNRCGLRGRKKETMPNGNNWGGAWPGAGRKKKPLAERLQNGQVAAAIRFHVTPDAPKMTKIKEYLEDEQRMGELYAKEIYEETFHWLADRGCNLF